MKFDVFFFSRDVITGSSTSLTICNVYFSVTLEPYGGYFIIVQIIRFYMEKEIQSIGRENCTWTNWWFPQFG